MVTMATTRVSEVNYSSASYFGSSGYMECYPPGIPPALLLLAGSFLHHPYGPISIGTRNHNVDLLWLYYRWTSNSSPIHHKLLTCNHIPVSEPKNPPIWEVHTNLPLASRQNLVEYNLIYNTLTSATPAEGLQCSFQLVRMLTVVGKMEHSERWPEWQ